MVKFKIGDKVRVVENKYSVPVGATAIVREYRQGDGYDDTSGRYTYVDWVRNGLYGGQKDTGWVSELFELAVDPEVELARLGSVRRGARIEL